MISDDPVCLNGVPSWWRIVCTDSALLVAFGFVLMVISLAFFHWALYAFELMLPERADLEAPRLDGACVIAAVTSAPLLLPGLWWVFVTRRAFRSGTRVSGRIRKLSRARGTMLVEYDFKHNGIFLYGQAFQRIPCVIGSFTRSNV